MHKVSIIIATFNRCHSLKHTLQSLKALEGDGSFNGEIIVVDNNSTDATKNTVESYYNNFKHDSHGTLSLTLKYVFEPKQGKSYALNRGIAEARGEIIVFTDDDVIADSKWLLSIIRCFDRYQCDGVGGRVLPVYPDNTPEWVKGDMKKMSGIVVNYDYGEKSMRYDSSMAGFIGANYAFKREVFDDCGVFRVDLGGGRIPVGEDKEFIRRIFKKGKSLYYCGGALIWHPVDLKRANLKHVMQWNIALGRYAARKEQENAAQTLVYTLDVPNYLIKGIIQDFFCIFLTFWNKKSLFFSLRRFFRKVGMIMEYRNKYQRETIKERSHARG